jgi:hypothetical protein
MEKTVLEFCYKSGLLNEAQNNGQHDTVFVVNEDNFARYGHQVINGETINLIQAYQRILSIVGMLSRKSSRLEADILVSSLEEIPSYR